MLTAIASAINVSLCGVLNTQYVRGFDGSTMRPDDAIEIIGSLASATTSTIASELGVTVEPMMTSALSSVISLRVLVTAFVVSDASSRITQLIFWPSIDCGSSSNVLRSGMPSDAAGPVADSVTPIVMSARAALAAAAIATASATFNPRFICFPLVARWSRGGSSPSLPLQLVTDLAQQQHVLRRRRRGRRLGRLETLIHLVELLDHDEDDQREDGEVEHDREEIAVRQERHAGLGQRVVGHRPVIPRRRRRQHDEVVREVEAAEDLADDRHDDVLDQRVDDLAEGCADDHADGEVDDIALHRELPELRAERHECSSFVARTAGAAEPRGAAPRAGGR